MPPRFPDVETANLGIVQCRKFRSVTVTSHLCQSVELVQHVTVTGVGQIERNGTVLSLNYLLTNFEHFICSDLVFDLFASRMLSLYVIIVMAQD